MIPKIIIKPKKESPDRSVGMTFEVKPTHKNKSIDKENIKRINIYGKLEKQLNRCLLHELVHKVIMDIKDFETSKAYDDYLNYLKEEGDISVWDDIWRGLIDE